MNLNEKAERVLFLVGQIENRNRRVVELERQLSKTDKGAEPEYFRILGDITKAENEALRMSQEIDDIETAIVSGSKVIAISYGSKNAVQVVIQTQLDDGKHASQTRHLKRNAAGHFVGKSLFSHRMMTYAVR